MATKEQLITFIFITFLFMGVGGFNYYLESKVYSEIRLSPGGSEISYIFYISLAVIWIIIAVIIFVSSKKKKLTKLVINEKGKLPVKKLLRNNKK